MNDMNIYHLTENEKTDYYFDAVKKINDKSFVGLENPPVGILREKFDTGTVYLARVGTTKIVGFAIVTVKNGSPFLWSIAVDPEYRDLGFGRKLLAWINVRVQPTIELTCRDSNPAQKLYFDMGYRVVAVLRDFYGPEENGLRMRRN